MKTIKLSNEQVNELIWNEELKLNNLTLEPWINPNDIPKHYNKCEIELPFYVKIKENNDLFLSDVNVWMKCDEDAGGLYFQDDCDIILTKINLFKKVVSWIHRWF